MNNFIETVLKFIQFGKIEIANFLLENYTERFLDDPDAKFINLIFNLRANELKKNNFRLLNLGCGHTFHPDWINIDFNKTGEFVIQYNLLNGIPFLDNSFDVVYHSHVLEHFPKRYAQKFIKECFRVLKPGGIIRVVCPDLEEIAKIYLENLQLALQGDESAKIKYEWILLELFDQMVRNTSGGEMYQFWRQMPLPCEDFIYKRVGLEAKKAIEEIRKQGNTISQNEYKTLSFQIETNPLKIGEFRLSGEIHQWMYDRFSLRELLQNAGFTNIEKVNPYTSRIPNFSKYQLDVTADGEVRKPDSLFMEAIKPIEKPIHSNLSYVVKTEKQLVEKNDKHLKISHLSVWDTGGAGTAAIRLHLALLRLGVDSNFIVIYKNTNIDKVFEIERKEYAEGWNWNTYYTQWYQNLKKEYPNRPDDLEVFTSVKGVTDAIANRIISDSNIINFHWISSFVDFEDDLLTFKNKRIVWTLHDENAFTGGCHYTSGCEKYLEECGSCPQLNSTNAFDLSRRQFWIKHNFVENNDITIVTPSKWLQDRVRKSYILKNKSSFHIFNGIPTGFFHRYEKTNARKLLNLPLDSFLILFGAEYYTKRKGFHLLKEFIEKCPIEISGKKVELVVFGDTNLTNYISKLPIHQIGFVKNQVVLAMLYSASDVFLMLSLEDNLPNTAIESICCGTPVVAFDIGGLNDIIEHKQNGWLAKPFSLDDIVEGVTYLSGFNEEVRKNIAINAQNKFNDINQARNYVELYNLLTTKSQSSSQIGFESPFRFDFDLDIKENLLIPPLKSILHNFSGLDQNYLGKIINHNKLNTEDFINLFITRLLFSLNFGLTNFLIVNFMPNPFLLKLPSLFKYQLANIHLDKTNYFKETSYDNQPVFELSLDNFENIFNLYNPNLTFLILDLDTMIKEKFFFLNFKSELINLNLSFSSQMILFMNFKFSQLDSLKKFLEGLELFQPELIQSIIDHYVSKKDEIVVENIRNEEYTILTISFNYKYAFLEKLKSINFIKHYQVDFPKISIVTPNLNQGKYLEECIKSIVYQDYPNLEYIVIDGGSTDGSVNIIKKFEKNINYWVSEKDNGQYDAINKGFNLSTGDILAWLNADDFYLPGTLHFVAECFTTYPFVDWITTTNITTLSVNGEIQTDWGFKKYSLKQILEGDYDKPFIQQESTFWKRSLWNRSGGKLNTKYDLASDLELWIRFFEVSELFVLDCPLAVFRFQPESKTGQNYNKYIMEANSLIKEKKHLFGLSNDKSKVSNFISFLDFLEKSNFKIVRSVLDKIITMYKNLGYPTASTKDKKNLEELLLILQNISILFKK